MTPWLVSDERLLDELARALSEPHRLDAATVDLLMTGYDLVHLEAREAELVWSSRDAPLVATRSTSTETLQLTFEAGGLSIELDITDRLLTGHIDPPSRAIVYFEQIGATARTAVDELGSFEFALTSNRLFRLRVDAPKLLSTVTPWLRPS